MIIDTHTHVVSSDKVKHPLDPGARGWSTEVSNDVEDLIAEMDRAGVACATLVQPNATYGLDNSYQCDSATAVRPADGRRGDPGPGGARCRGPALLLGARARHAGRAPPESGRARRSPLRPALAARRRPRRPHLHRRRRPAGEGRPDADTWAPGTPHVIFAPDHFAGWSGAQDKAAMTTALERLAQLPNAYVRISSTSLGPYADLTPPEQALFRRVIEAFTPRRVMWGSNFPSSRAGGYIGQVQLGQTALAWLSDDDRRWIMGETAHTLWPMLQGPARG